MGGGANLRHVGVLLGQHEARGVERPADLIGQETLDWGNGVIEPPQVPHLHQPVLARCQHQVAMRERPNQIWSNLYKNWEVERNSEQNRRWESLIYTEYFTPSWHSLKGSDPGMMPKQKKNPPKKRKKPCKSVLSGRGSILTLHDSRRIDKACCADRIYEQGRFFLPPHTNFNSTAPYISWVMEHAEVKESRWSSKRNDET